MKLSGFPVPPSWPALPILALLIMPGLVPATALEAQANQDRDPPVLVVSGTARVEVAPDRARISFAVETEAETAREAGDANARLMDRVIEAVRGTELRGLRVETSGYTLTPRYRTVRDDRTREIAGYTARNHVQVIVDEVEPVGRIVDAALDAGANRVAGLQFEVRDPEPHRREALRQAVAQARGEAEVMAEALGVRLGSPQHVQGGAEIPFPRGAQLRMEVMAMADEAPMTPVEAGLQTISANVTIRFLIHDED
jgi:uncharacterized protein